MASFGRSAPGILSNLNYQQQVRLVELTGRIPILLCILTEGYHDMRKNELSEASEVGRVENLVDAAMEGELVTLIKEQISTLRQKDINALKQYIPHLPPKVTKYPLTVFRFRDGWSDRIFESPTWLDTESGYGSSTCGMARAHASRCIQQLQALSQYSSLSL